jgi:hypothetical protein
MGKVLLALVALAVPGAAVADGIASLEVDGNQATAEIALPGGLGADLTLTFENAVGLSAASLGLSAEAVNPLDAALLARLPGGSLVSLPAAFPVLVRVQPEENSPLSFSGVYQLSLHTHNLQFVAGCPLRIFHASAGGPFADVTSSIGTGSYRGGATGGSFSEFLILSDTRPLVTVIAGKFAALDGLLTAHGSAITPEVLSQLDALADAAQAAYDQNQLADAIEQLELFADLVKSASGAAISDVWRPTGDVTNVAGLLRAATATLRFSINLQHSPV